MQEEKQSTEGTKEGLHPRNKHNTSYNFNELIKHHSALKKYVITNEHGNETIDFFNPRAVKALNKALLLSYYAIQEWSIPRGYLCPPIPSRADYLHHAADLLSEINENSIPIGPKVKVYDLGVGANCVYPIIGNAEYGWSFVGADIDGVAVSNANHIIKSNHPLRKHAECRLQPNPSQKFSGVIEWNERFDLVVCNPPFHSSADEATAGTNRKLRNLTRKRDVETELNFGGKSNELWTEGGERAFILSMINDSKRYKKQILWFSTLVSKAANLPAILDNLEKSNITETRTIELHHGNKQSRIVLWSFQTADEQKKWAQEHW